MTDTQRPGGVRPGFYPVVARRDAQRPVIPPRPVAVLALALTLGAVLGVLSALGCESEESCGAPVCPPNHSPIDERTFANFVSSGMCCEVNEGERAIVEGQACRRFVDDDGCESLCLSECGSDFLCIDPHRTLCTNDPEQC